ncbi:hypothetical protein QFC22_005852 [Naganishia vaughanmartiniae]|uniref:Uncharacterized protein n=1 Tax=Naganishia vaughanmartiniae TaxID=1424756 RepID=A0ACC2WU23_9TREE|nr:hypothetical protein QFC22_005852 [Naganishia vaughanmartiniae]
MASPVHRYLFSPPTSPTAPSRSTRGSHSPLLEPHESLHAIGRLFSPALGGSSNNNEQEVDGKKHTPTQTQTQTQLAGPGGFVSTRAYPTRCVSPLDLASSASSSSGHGQGYELPPFPPTSTSSSASAYQPRRSASQSRRNSSTFLQLVGGPTNIPTTDYLLPPPANTQRPSLVRKQYTISAIRPKTAVRLLLAIVAIISVNALLRSSGSAIFPGLQLGGGKAAALTAEGMRQQLLDMEKISVVAGKKVRVTGQFGAPTTLLYDDASHHAVAPARAYRPIVSPPITETQELLALQSYLLANPTHSLPADTNTNRPLDPMTLVGFPPNDARGWKELKQEVEPVVIWSTGKTWTTPVQQLLDLYGIEPQPVVLEMQSRPDASQLAETLARLIPGRSAASGSSSHSPPPLITIGGQPINGYSSLSKLHKEGKLHGLLERAGAVVDARSKREEADKVKRARLETRLAKQARIVLPVRDVEGDDE